MNRERHIILFDGVCNLCNGSVRFVHKRDKKEIFRYQSLQSEKGKKLLQEMEYEETSMKSFIYIQGNRLFTKSDAALQVAKQLGFPLSLLFVFIIVPRFIRNGVYDFIAKNRYKWFGKQKEVCEFDPSFSKKIV